MANVAKKPACDFHRYKVQSGLASDRCVDCLRLLVAELEGLIETRPIPRIKYRVLNARKSVPITISHKRETLLGIPHGPTEIVIAGLGLRWDDVGGKHLGLITDVKTNGGPIFLQAVIGNTEQNRKLLGLDEFLKPATP